MSSNPKVNFRSPYMYRQFYNKLPKISKWAHVEIKWYLGESPMTGDAVYEVLHLWKKDVMEVIQELLENLEYKDEIAFTPLKVYTDKEKTEWIYGEGFTADLWHEIMVSVEYIY